MLLVKTNDSKRVALASLKLAVFDKLRQLQLEYAIIFISF